MQKNTLKKLQQGTKVLKQAAFQPETILFDKQLEFLRDPADIKVCCCSRRAGKSYAVAVLLIETALNYSDSSSIYIAQTKAAGIQIIWHPLLSLIEKFGLECKPNNQTHEISFSNGSKIVLKGTKDVGEIDSIRGVSPSPRVVVLDEAGHFRSFLKALINEVIMPALMDYMGTLVLIGTPNPMASGEFYDAYHRGKGYEDAATFHWTFFDNTKLPAVLNKVATHDEIFQKTVLSKGRKLEDADVQREYFGKWVKDVASQLFHYVPSRNDVKELPEGDWKYILGVDTGYIDNCGYCVIAYNGTSTEAYIVEAYERDFKDVTSIIDEVNLLNFKYDFTRIIFDPASGGKNMMAELYMRHGLRAESASKSEKKAHIALLNDDLRNGRLFILHMNCEDLVFCWANLEWIIKANGVKIPGTHIGAIKADHVSDASLYAWREAQHYRAKPVIKNELTIDREVNIHYTRLQKEAVLRTKKENQKLLKKLKRVR
jgi:hypothetical protein